jgi:hypothetical protein
MKRRILKIGIALTVALCVLLPVTSQAQKMGPSDEMLKGAYRDILAQADKNRDGKLSAGECLAIWKDKQKGEKDCKYWDANGDGVITEDEYVKQVRKIMR